MPDQNGITNGAGNPPATETPGTGAKPPETKPAEGTGKDTETFTLQVLGQPRTVTKEELLGLASKAAGADEKFEKAAEMRKRAERGISVIEAVEKVRNQTATKAEVELLADVFGMNPADLPGYSEGEPKKGEKKGEERRVVEEEDLSPAIKSAVQYSREQELREIRKDIEGQTGEAVTKDAVLQRSLEGLPAELRKTVLEELIEMAKLDVRDGICVRNQLFGPDLLNDTIQKLRHRVERLGIPTSRAGHSSTGAGVVPMMGAGMLGSMGINIPDKPVQRVPVTDPNYENVTVQRALQFQQKAMRSQQS